MPYVMKRTEDKCETVKISRMANGFVVEPGYSDSYTRDRDGKIASSVDEAVKAVKEYLNTPKINEERVWED